MTLWILIAYALANVLGYIIGRCHGRLLHHDEECAAEREGYEAGVKHGLECGIMMAAAGEGQPVSQHERAILHWAN
jgi:hypothetical protein